MAAGGGDSPHRFRRINWVSSREVQRLTSSGSAHSPASPEALSLSLEQVPPLTEDEHWYKKVSCCHLESSAGDGQGVIVCLGMDASSQQFAEILGISTYPAFALITCHHIITGRQNLKNWRLVVSGLEMKKSPVKLDERKFESCRSCCGPDGVLGREEHPNRVCPFGADFTVLVLTKEFACEMLKSRDLLIPLTMPLYMKSLREALQSNRFYLFKRDKSSGVIRSIELGVHKRAPPSEDEQSIDGQVTAYKEMCLLRYDKNVEILRGNSGAGIFLMEGAERLLLGVHKSTEADDERHTGIPIHAIYHAIASQVKGEACGLIPSLSHLKDAKRFNSCFRATYFRNVQLCLETKEGTAVQVSDEGNDLPLRRVLNILDYLLKQKLLVLTPDSELTVPSVDLLTSIFLYFHKCNHGHSKIKDELRHLFPGEAVRGAFYDSVCEVGEQIYKILCEPDQFPQLVESCMQCWLSLSYFPFPGSKPVFTDSMRFGRIGSIRKSKKFEKSLPVHKAFGDICLAYQLHLRGELNQAEKERDKVRGELNQAEKERDKLREALDQQREAFEQEIENIRKKVSADILQKDKQVAKTEAQIEVEKEEKTALVERLKKAEQISEEQQKKVVELQGVCDELQQSLVGANLAAHELDQLRSTLEIDVEQLKQENHKLNVENESMSRKLVQVHTSLPASSTDSLSPPHKSTSAPLLQPQGARIYPKRPDALPQGTLEVDFWSQDMANLLSANVKLRQELGKYFDKNEGSEGGGTWEHLIVHLERKLHPDFKMNATVLEQKPVGDILLLIVREWSKVGGKVTVEDFCDFSKNQLKIGRVEHVLSEVERHFLASRFSEDFCTPRPGDSFAEHV